MLAHTLAAISGEIAARGEEASPKTEGRASLRALLQTSLAALSDVNVAAGGQQKVQIDDLLVGFLKGNIADE
jgi:hypothetical protein